MTIAGTTPNEKYIKKRENIINSCFQALELLPNQFKDIENYETDEFYIKLKGLYIRSLVFSYFELPYIEIYFDWEHTFFENISNEVLKIISETIDFDPVNEAVEIYLSCAFCSEYFENELYKECKDNPAKAEKPIDSGDKEQFIHFLNEVFGPAYNNTIIAAVSGKYRKIAEIEGDYKAALYNHLEQVKTGNKELGDRSETRAFLDELSMPNRDFFEYIQLNAKQSGPFSELLDQNSVSFENPFASLTNIVTPEKITSMYPDKLQVNLTKAERLLSDFTTFDEKLGARVSSKKSKKKGDSVTYITLTPAEGEKDLKFSRPITIRDRSIINAIESLATCNTHMTASQVYKALNGGEDIKVTPETTKDIESRIDYMRRIMVTVDYTEHMNLNGHKGNYVLEGTLLKLDKLSYNLNGKAVIGYRYGNKSPLFEYAQNVGQIASVPLKMLDTKSVQRGGTRTDNIKQYLLFRIYTINSQGCTISLKTILNEIGEPDPSLQQLRSIHTIIQNLLDFWCYGKIRTDTKPADKDILSCTPLKGYSVNTTGKKITGYELIPKILPAPVK